MYFSHSHKSCWCIHPKVAGIIIGLLEVIHFLANLLLLIGAIIHHDRIFSGTVLFTAISLSLILAMIIVLFLGISKEKAHLIYIHLMYLIFSVLWYGVLLTLIIISFFFSDVVIDVYDESGNTHAVANAYIIIFVIVSALTLAIRVYAVIVIRRLYRYIRCKNVAWSNTRRPYYSKSQL
ncbi:hypothetical protein L596_001811 [Steinernema carpocapsae]|uniref:MARVEL domain-containing protein n=1 Tax=Steinernema carpocapsae TaxID=34508 RepID=A0A4U8UMU8_STECR|nr:hypothetical protein L596_001811 [Steinernema carpocapsae]